MEQCLFQAKMLTRMYDSATIVNLHLRWLLTVLCLCLANGMIGQNALIINEIQVANLDQYIDYSYNYGAWIELYNPSSEDVSLQRMTLKHIDSEGEVETFTLNNNHGIVPARNYALLWFDHYTGTGFYGSNAAKQVDIELDADGGRLELKNAQGVLMDAVNYPASIARSSFLRTTDGGSEWGYTAYPSPASTNNGCEIATERMDAPVVSVSGTVFKEPFNFYVDIPEGATLLYSTDGSVPMPGKGRVSNDGVFHVDNTTIFRFLLTRKGWLHSPVVTRSFIHDSQGYYLPVVSVCSHPDNFFDNTIGLYVRGTNGRVANNSKTRANQNMDWERPVNMEYLVPDANGQYRAVLNQEVRFTIFGGWTRFNEGNEFFEYRSSFKLKCEKVFEGINSYNYPIFDSKPYIKLKSLLVRNGGQDQDVRLKDAAIHEAVRTSGVYLDCQAWQPTHVFINGHYLGMLNLREESNRQFAYSNYGIDNDEIDQWENEFIIKAGDAKQMNRWYDAALNLGLKRDEESWQEVCAVLDVDEYCNYMAAECYSGNQDWLRGGIKNLKGFCCRGDDGRIHLVFHDLDGGFGVTDLLSQIFNKGTMKLSTIFKEMLRYEPFKKQFIDAYCLMGGSVFEAQRCRPIILDMARLVNEALQWEGTYPITKMQSLCNTLANASRKSELLQTLKNTFGLEGEYTLNIHSNVDEAKILLNGQEIPTGKFNWALFPPIQLTPIAPAGYVFKGWSKADGIFTTDSVLLVNELLKRGMYELIAMYEPKSDEANRAKVRINEVSSANDIYMNEYGKKSDWIELYNVTDEDIDLTGFYLSDNPQNPQKYQIGAESEVVNTMIPAHGFRIVWCDKQVPLSQLHTSFKLENADEGFVCITSADGEWCDSLRYLFQTRWHTYGRYADGGTELALFSRPTIGNSNSICTNTYLVHDSINTSIDEILMDDMTEDGVIASVEYYNLNGIRVHSLQPHQIYLQRTMYRNGRTRVRKMMER
ncbi:MAG: lamin tail domain-containing protein [Bacteroidaceae bacterium]|nr:lamin tail domain-containing protein [Bacteroidaceae bacterium]